MSSCRCCGARLRRAKPPWALCDPCDDQAHRDNVKREHAQEQARLAAGERACKTCGTHPVIVRSGIYAWLCTTCRDQARTDKDHAA